MATSVTVGVEVFDSATTCGSVSLPPTHPPPRSFAVQKGLVCTVGFVTSVFMSWVNNRYVFASVRRDILIWWSGALVDRFRESREPVYIQSTEQLAALTPNKQQVTDMVLLVYHGVVKPSIQSHDAVMAQVEGCVSTQCIRWSPCAHP
jgi:hypothetical protein